MKAQVLENVNELIYKEIPMPVCESGWAIVQVKAAGVCGSDIPRIFQNGTYHFPTIPGHEFSGVVHAVRADASIQEKGMLGKRVGIFPLIPCGICPSCRNKKYEMCERYNYLGSRCDGGFAEYVAVPVWNLIELPEEVPFEAAAMLEPIAVALHGVKRSGMTEGKTVAIYGMGTIGMLMAQWCRIYGAKKVLCIGTREAQKELMGKLDFPAADFHITTAKTQENQTYIDEDVQWVQAQTGGAGADIVIECVGNPVVMNNAILSTKAEGTILMVGNPQGDVTFDKNVYWRILRKQLHITGTWNSGYVQGEMGIEPCDWTEAVEVLRKGNLRATELITHRVSLEDLLPALQSMRDKREYTNKVMIRR